MITESMVGPKAGKKVCQLCKLNCYAEETMKAHLQSTEHQRSFKANLWLYKLIDQEINSIPKSRSALP